MWKESLSVRIVPGQHHSPRQVQHSFAVTASREDGNPLAFTLALQPHAEGDGVNHGTN